MHKSRYRLHNKKYLIDDRRRQVSMLLSQSLSETEIATQLSVNQSTISRDIKILKEMSLQNIHDLAFLYEQSILGIEAVKKHTWDILKEQDLTVRDRLYALKLIKECNESKFNLFKEGPSLLNIQTLENRLNQIENRQNS